MYSGLTVNATNSDENLSELHLQINSGKDSEVCPISDESSEQRTTDDENEEERGSFEWISSNHCRNFLAVNFTWLSPNIKVSGKWSFQYCTGKTKHPVLLMSDNNCEELAFPVLFPKGRFGYMVERAVYSSPTRYFSAHFCYIKVADLQWMLSICSLHSL